MEHLERRSRGCAGGGDPCVAAPAVEKEQGLLLRGCSCGGLAMRQQLAGRRRGYGRRRHARAEMRATATEAPMPLSVPFRAR